MYVSMQGLQLLDLASKKHTSSTGVLGGVSGTWQGAGGAYTSMLLRISCQTGSGQWKQAAASHPPSSALRMAASTRRLVSSYQLSSR